MPFNRKDILRLTYSIHELLASGLNIVQSLALIEKNYLQDHSMMKSIQVIKMIKNKIISGQSVADSFKNYAEQFGFFYVNLIKLGENSNNLCMSFKYLYEYLNKINSHILSIKRILLYPCVILSIGFMMIMLIIIFIVPYMSFLFSASINKFPLITKLIIALSSFINNSIKEFILILLLIMVIIIFFLKKVSFSQFFSKKIFIYFPIINKLIFKFNEIKFLHCLFICLSVNNNLLDSIKIILNIFALDAKHAEYKKILNLVENGFNLSEALKLSNIVSFNTITLLGIAEETGNFQQIIQKTLTSLNNEFENMANALKTIIEPVAILIVGILISTFLITIYIPIFHIGNTVYLF